MPQPLVIIFTFLSNLIFGNNLSLKAIPTPTPDPLIEVISQMSLEDKIRQTLICSFSGNSSESSLKTLEFCGNLIYLKNNLFALTDEEIKNNNQAIHDKDPLAWIMIDQEGGRVARIVDGSPTPRQMVNEGTIGHWGKQHGETLKKLGFNVDLAPVVDITKNNPVILDRSFADDPELNGHYSSEYLKALQDEGILGVIKHLPGHGRVDNDTHEKSGSLDYEWDEIRYFDLVPFIETIKSGAKIAMIGHIVIPEIDSVPASISPKIISLLRSSLPSGQDIIFITDSLAMSGVGLPQDKASVKALSAGEDMILIQDTSVEQIYSEILESYKNNKLSEESLNKSVFRILKLKKSQN